MTRSESLSALCRSYPHDYFPAGVYPEYYIHCDGTQLKLTDTDFGRQQYRSSDYYVWSAGSYEQLLFIFSQRVSLTTITLHYYSDSVRGLPRLSFYAVPDNFNIWNSPQTSYPRVEVAEVRPGGEPGHNSISINATFNTRKILMFEHGRFSVLAVSEVQFFNCKSK